MSENAKTRRVERRHHKVDRLPRRLRDELARRFQAGETYDGLVTWLASEGHEVGRSSVHRWGSRFQRHLEKLRAWREAAQTVVADLEGKPATELNEAAEQTAVQMIFEALVDLQETAEAPAAAKGEGGGEAPARPDLKRRAATLSSLAHALSGLGYSAANRERLKLAFAREFQADKQAAAETASKALQSAGAASETVTEVVDRILGIGGG